MKKLFALMLFLIALLACFTAASADTASFPEGEFVYTVQNGEATITGWSTDSWQPVSLDIPAKLNGYDVVAIGDSAIEFKRLTSLTLPEGLRTIGYSAFGSTHCSSAITIPASVTGIGNYAFSYMYGVPEFKVAEGNAHYVAIDGALYTADLTTLLNFPLGSEDEALVVPDSVTLLYCTSLANSGVNTLIVPSPQVRAMGYTFWGCTMDVYGQPDTQLAQSIAAGYFDNITFHDIATYTGATSLSLNIKSYEGFSVEGYRHQPLKLIPTATPEEWADGPFTWTSSNTAVATVDGEGNVTICGSGSARITVKVGKLSSHCNLNITPFAFEMSLPTGLTLVGASAFEDCRAVTSVRITPDAPAVISANAFSDCTQLRYVYLSEKVTQIDDGAFLGCPDVVIICPAGSAAESYANANQLPGIILTDGQNPAD